MSTLTCEAWLQWHSYKLWPFVQVAVPLCLCAQTVLIRTARSSLGGWPVVWAEGGLGKSTQVGGLLPTALSKYFCGKPFVTGGTACRTNCGKVKGRELPTHSTADCSSVFLLSDGAEAPR